MPKQHLRETLQELHEELESTDSVDKENRELLRELMQDIRHLLEKSGEPSSAEQTSWQERHRSLQDRLRHSAQDFEESHPSLTMALRRVIDALQWMSV
jgi:ElaB/YqjD/DUF883 family membrane-anchored ribosome-binding protein